MTATINHIDHTVAAPGHDHDNSVQISLETSATVDPDADWVSFDEFESRPHADQPASKPTMTWAKLLESKSNIELAYLAGLQTTGGPVRWRAGKPVYRTHVKSLERSLGVTLTGVPFCSRPKKPKPPTRAELTKSLLDYASAMEGKIVASNLSLPTNSIDLSYARDKLFPSI